MISDPLKQQIKEANDIVDVVSSYISLQPRGGTFKGLCPFHDDHRPSFDVDPRRQRYRCWSCGAVGDVIKFIEEHVHVSFREALELLARRVGISLEKNQKFSQGPSRAGMLDVMRWATEQFQECLLESPLAETARKYLGERKLTGETVRKFALGFAPPMGEWLVQKAVNSQISTDLLETVGLIAKRSEGRGYYDRFRDRVMFPIRDTQGHVVGFGGRILPTSSLSDRVSKYYNSSETPLFSKSDQLYGIDLARQPAAKCGYLAIFEGYTDVLMAHQYGISQVIATMGTALNARHIKQLRRLVSNVVLVFDADAGGDTGVDRAMEVFVSHDLDLKVATLPEGLDPCDLLVAHGPEPLRQALEQAIDVFEYKLQRECAKYGASGIEGQTRIMENMLRIMATAPIERSPKMELMVKRMLNRLAHRFSQIKEETVWTRLRELRASRKDADARQDNRPDQVVAVPEPTASAKAPRHEIEFMELLLAEPTLVPQAQLEVPLDEMENPVLRKVMEALCRLHAEGQTPDLDHLRGLLDNERLWNRLHDLKDHGLDYPDRPEMFRKVLDRFRERREQRRTQDIKSQLQHAEDPASQLEILRKLNDQKK